MKILGNITEAIGHTPLVQLNRLTSPGGARVVCKLESVNPGFSVKDRIALHMIDAAEQSGQLRPGGVIIEATSGNAGVGLAMVAAARGYRLIITMPESMTRERRLVIQQLGAEIILTPACHGMAGAIAKAETLAAELQNAFMPRQFDNPANPETHSLTTARELWADTDGQVDIFVAGIGTGGTITGVGRYLKQQRRTIAVYGVEPDESPVLNGGRPGRHQIQGIGAGFKPTVLDLGVVDRVFRITSADALQTAQALAAREGILAGISSGANVCAALKLATQPEHAGKLIVTLICDTGERYLSTALFNHS